MSRYRRILCFGLVPLIACAFVVLAFRPSEPSYRGRTLTSWLRQFVTTPLHEEERRAEAEEAIRAIGAEKALPHLMRMVKAKDGPIRSWIADKSESWGFRILKEPEAEWTQQFGITGFELLETNCAAAVPELTRLLDNPNHAFAAVRCLSCIGKSAEAALCQSLTNRDWRVRHWAIPPLAGVTDDAEEYVARVKPRLTDSESVVRCAALEAIGTQAELPEIVVPVLLAALQDNDEHFSSSAAALLRDYATNAPRVFNALTNAVEDSRSVVANQALRTVVAVAPQQALPMILRDFKSSDSPQRRRAAGHLLDYPVTIPEIRAALERAAADPDPQMSRMAQNYLTKLYRTEHPIELEFPNEPSWEGKALSEWLKMRVDGYVFAGAATNAFRQMGTNAIPALLKRLTYRQPPYKLKALELNLEAACALASMAELARPALPKLEPLIDSDDADLALHAMIATCGMGAEAVGCLLKGLTNRSEVVRNEAAAFLEQIGPRFQNERKRAIPFLVKLLEDPSESVRSAARNALKEIDSDAVARHDRNQ